MLFATPDFGASGGIVCCLAVVWAFILVAVLLAIVKGVKLFNSDSRQARRFGVLLLLASGLVPLSCCFGPSQFVRLEYGNYPLGTYPTNKVQEGMTADEVVAALGTPHERHGDNKERWYYWIDSFSIRWFSVEFGPDGRVDHTYGN
jgi:hypothetical protein